MRDIGSHAPRLKVMGRPPPGRKPLRSRRSGRAGESVGASESLDDVPQDPRLPSYPPDGPSHRLHDLYGSLSARLGISLGQVIEELAPYLIGWRGYFGFRQTPPSAHEPGSLEPPKTTNVSSVAVAQRAQPLQGTAPQRRTEVQCSGRRRFADGILAHVNREVLPYPDPWLHPDLPDVPQVRSGAPPASDIPSANTALRLIASAFPRRADLALKARIALQALPCVFGLISVP